MATANGSRDGDSKRHDPRRDMSWVFVILSVVLLKVRPTDRQACN